MSSVSEEKLIKLTVLSPERRLIENVDVEEVTLTGSEGQIQVLPGHVSMMGTLETGTFGYRVPGESPTEGVISSGFFEVQGNHVTVTAETLEIRDEIDVDRARRAQKAAEDALKAAELDEHQFKKYQLKLERSLIRQQVAAQGHAEH